MKIGVPKEIKTNENRIALVPAGAESNHFSMNAELRRLLDVPIDTDRHSSDSS